MNHFSSGSKFFFRLWRCCSGFAFLERDFKQIPDFVVRLRMHVRIDAINDFFLRQNPERPENPVPNGKDIPIIAVGIWHQVMVVHLVHVGRNDDVTQQRIEFFRQRNIRMIEL